MKVSYGVYRTIKYAEQAFQHTVKGNREMKINKENNLIRKMTNRVIVINGPRIESFFPPCKIIGLKMILYLRMII